MIAVIFYVKSYKAVVKPPKHLLFKEQSIYLKKKCVKIKCIPTKYICTLC